MAIFDDYPRGIDSQKELARLCTERYKNAFGLSKKYDETPIRRLVDDGKIIKEGNRLYANRNNPQGTLDSRRCVDDTTDPIRGRKSAQVHHKKTINNHYHSK